ncbi:hypothetical protein I79_009375 [Cricetulus griseus]|uniref:Uncharacterized protein n=1 Tax=Cricetulus griseus TaxID=10029 RepID=G3HFL3_CRIGR|nr:hypothetical protein I79_009375 [Cricetulus griseus]
MEKEHLRAHILIHTQEVKRANSKWHEFFESLKPAPRDTSSKGTPASASKQLPTGDQVFKHESLGTFFGDKSQVGSKF